eukprot:snap_masked-scaffold_14-processed-gene-4.39-mRNA-1 protein AED:1.00 eAED:1.00 QI:0/0/0/0/1/1/5/0/976
MDSQETNEDYFLHFESSEEKIEHLLEKLRSTPQTDFKKEIKEILEWRLQSFRLLKANSVRDLSTLKAHLDKAWENEKLKQTWDMNKSKNSSVFFKEFLQLKKTYDTSTQWHLTVTKIFPDLGSSRINSRRRGNRGVAQKVQRKVPSYAELEKLSNEIKKFMNIFTPKVLAFENLFKECQIYNHRLNDKLKEFKELKENPKLGKRPLGLSGADVIVARRIADEASVYEARFEKAMELEEYLDHYNYLRDVLNVLRTSTIGQKNANEKLLALVANLRDRPALKKIYQRLKITDQKELQDAKLYDEVHLLQVLKNLVHGFNGTTNVNEIEAKMSDEESADEVQLVQKEVPIAKAKPKSVKNVKKDFSSKGSIINRTKVNKEKNLDASRAESPRSVISTTPRVNMLREAIRFRLYKRNKRRLAKTKGMLVYEHGYVVSLGRIDISREYVQNKMILPVGYKSRFRFAHWKNTSEKVEYTFTVLQGPKLRVHIPDSAFSVQHESFKELSKFFLKTFRDLKDHPNLWSLVGLNSKLIVQSVEGCAFSYLFLGEDKWLVLLEKNKNKNLENLLKIDEPNYNVKLFDPNYTKNLKAYNLFQIQHTIRSQKMKKGVAQPNVFFHEPDYRTLGKAIRTSFQGLISWMIEVNRGSNEFDIEMTLPGCLTKDDHISFHDQEKKSLISPKFGSSPVPSKKTFTYIEQPKKKIPRVIRQHFYPVYYFSNEFEFTDLLPQEAKREKMVGLKRKRNTHLKSLATVPEYFHNFRVYYFDKKLQKVVDTSIDGQDQTENVKPRHRRLTEDVFQIYDARLSSRPRDIFMSRDCICGHEFHCPRMTLTLRKIDTVVCAVTTCIYNFSFHNKKFNDICIFEVESIATKPGADRTGFASYILSCLRYIAVSVENKMGKEVGMVAKTSSSSEAWWGTRKHFYNSLREIKKSEPPEAYEKWKTLIEESGEDLHMFFSHGDTQGRSVYWLSKNDIFNNTINR